MKTLELSSGLLQREVIVDQTLARIFALVSFVILTAVGAYVRIPLPFTPVPITLQTFFVLLSGAVLGKKWGAASQSVYLCVGILGVPIFSGFNSGLAYMLGPTGGYLIGFIAASWIVGFLIRRNDANKVGLSMILGSLGGIYLFGILGLSLFFKCSLSKALMLGFYPFLPGAIVKITAAVFVYRLIERRAREIFD